jgi:LCP family protein required for cell wall assembly
LAIATKPATSDTHEEDEALSTPAESRTRGRWPKLVAGGAALAVVTTALVGAGMDYVYGTLQDNIDTVDVSGVVGRAPNTTVIDDAGNYKPITMLLMGSDSRQDDNDGGYGDPTIYTGERSDTTILLHVSADRSFATAVSIPRDTWVTIPQCPRTGTGEMAGGFEDKFNIAFEIGGPGCTQKLVEEMTGLEIDHFAVIDFAGFKTVVDALGGVEVCLTEAVDDPQSKLVLPAGTSVVDGEQALAFVRARKTLSDGSDLSRIKRQQAFLSSMIRKATDTQLLLNPVQLYSVLDAATSSLTTDPGLAQRDVLQDTVLSARGVRPEDITFLTMPWLERGDGANVVIDTERAAGLWASIADDVPWLTPKKESGGSTDSGAVVSASDISLRVLNGSGIAGRAGQVAALLSGQGFTIVDIANADRPDYSVTEIRYPTGQEAIGEAMAAALPGALAVEDVSGTVITIVIGADFTGVNPVAPSDSPTPSESTASEQESDGSKSDQITDPTTANTVRCN